MNLPKTPPVQFRRPSIGEFTFDNGTLRSIGTSSADVDMSNIGQPLSETRSVVLELTGSFLKEGEHRKLVLEFPLTSTDVAAAEQSMKLFLDVAGNRMISFREEYRIQVLGFPESKTPRAYFGYSPLTRETRIVFLDVESEHGFARLTKHANEVPLETIREFRRVLQAGFQ